MSLQSLWASDHQLLSAARAVAQLYLESWDFHRVVDGQRPLQDGAGHDRPLTTDGEAVVHGHEEVTCRVSLREVGLFLQKLKQTKREVFVFIQWFT